MPAAADQAPRQPTPPAAWDDQLLRNPHAVADKRRRVQKMFAAIAPSYDLNNHLHSLWMDKAWRRRAVQLAQLTPNDRVVDVACGTGDLSIEFADCLMQLSNATPRLIKHPNARREWSVDLH